MNPLLSTSRLLKILFIIACVHFGSKELAKWGGTPFSAQMTSAQLNELASTVKSSDVVMYTTTECGYCGQAKGWLKEHDFAFTECNLSVSPSCQSQFKALGANGIPYLVVRGHHMKNGFDSNEFIALLQK